MRENHRCKTRICETNLTIAPDAVDFLSQKRLIFTITSGRSGTTLLTELLRQCLGIDVEHEPTPRLNYVFCAVMAESKAAGWWLQAEKLPHIAATMKGDIYIETSHLYYKGFREPLLALGLRPPFIILTRPATAVARNLFQISCIPERTGAGRLALIGPSDLGVLCADE
jgi:hypothetical protein